MYSMNPFQFHIAVVGVFVWGEKIYISFGRSSLKTVFMYGRNVCTLRRLNLTGPCLLDTWILGVKV